MIDIVYKTADFVVVNKNAGVPSQSDPSGDKDAMTLCSEKLRSMGERDELFLIHRLDRVVGGLIVFARNKKAAAELSSAVSEQRMVKEYFAVASGVPSGGEMKDFLYKDATLGKAFVTDRKRAGVKEARLEHSVLATVEAESGALSLVRVRLITGRFHQIRAQFASRGMPLIGDRKYGSRDFNRKTPALFAAKLEFDFKGKRVNVTALPNYLEYPFSLFEKEKYVL